MVTSGALVVPDTEKQMVEAAASHLASSDISYALEVPFMTRSIDLVYEDEGSLVTVEFKRHDWRRALRQVRDHSLGTELNYVCLPKGRITGSLKREAAELGVGILGWTPETPMEEILPPGEEGTAWEIGREWLAKRFEFRNRSAE